MSEHEVKSTYLSFSKSQYLSMKHQNYFAIYDELLTKYIGKDVTFVEVGILNGGSLFMWRDFLGSKARIIGIDFNPNALKWEKYGFEIHVGDQSDPQFWKKFFRKTGNIDVLLDDGGHTNEQQIVTTQQCLPFINDGGTLIIEDVHASYQYEFGNPSKFSFVNYAKSQADNIQYRFPNLPNINKFNPNRSIHSVSFYESIVAFRIDRRLAIVNKPVLNEGISDDAEDFRNHGTNINLIKYFLERTGLRRLIPRKFELLVRKIYFLPNNIRLKKYWRDFHNF